MFELTKFFRKVPSLEPISISLELDLRKLDLILTEKSYFMVSDKIDLTNEIIEKLNQKNLTFKYNIN